MVVIDTKAKHSLINLENDETAVYRLIEVHHLFELFESRLLTLVSPKLNYQDLDNLDICRLPIGDPADFIDEIVFDPRMPNSLVRAYTTHLTTTFNYAKSCFKSKIYESPKLRIEVEKIY